MTNQYLPCYETQDVTQRAMEEKKEGIYVYLPVDLATKLRVFAAQERASISSVVQQAIEEFFRKS